MDRRGEEFWFCLEEGDLEWEEAVVTCPGERESLTMDEGLVRFCSGTKV